MPSQTWILDGGCARMQLLGLTGLIDSQQPRLGLAAIAVQQTDWRETRLLGVSGEALNSSAASVAEWHIRGSDLFATYELASPYSARIDLCWHAEAGNNGDPWFARIDFVVSLRTDKLDWRHDLFAESDMRCALPLPGRQGYSSFALDRWSYAEFVHPADLRGDDAPENLACPGRCCLRRHLFLPESLEKGVILRARIRGLLLPPAVSPTTVEECYDEFIAADPPLSG